jgi:hypothetical protein
MNPPSLIKRLRAVGTRRTLGVLLLMWVGLGIQPCAVAAVSDAKCPHCPPAVTSDQATLHDHGNAHGESPSGVYATADCCEVDDGTVDARPPPADSGSLQKFAAAPPPAMTAMARSSSYAVRLSSDPPERRRSSVPLRILYCVYRD